MASYEEIREGNIKRNKQFLEELGLVALPPRAVPPAVARNKRRCEEQATIRSDSMCASRRSPRIAQLACPAYEEAPPERTQAPAGKRPDVLSSTQVAAVVSLKRKQEDVEVQGSPIRLEKTSCLNLCADISFFLRDGVLGHPMSTFGKAAVMAAANGGKEPKFSKFPGVVEWQNALFLWVNVAAPDNEYHNEFLEGGKAITWFGGSCPKVQRLLSSIGTQVQGEVSRSGQHDVVLLFVRVPRGNYISLGRVSCRSADLTTHPIRMTWALEDFDRLTLSRREDTVSKAACDTFKDIIAATNSIISHK